LAAIVAVGEVPGVMTIPSGDSVVPSPPPRTRTLPSAVWVIACPSRSEPPATSVTWLPIVGAVIERGDTVYRVDQERVPLLYGSIPLYRTLSTGSRGDDVRQLERNLSALGYTGFTVDDQYTAATASAARAMGDSIIAPPSATELRTNCLRSIPVSAPCFIGGVAGVSKR